MFSALKERNGLIGYSVAMKNALPEAKLAAHEVSIYTNQEDGVFKELERLIQ